MVSRTGLGLGLATLFCPCHFPFILLGLSFLLFGTLVVSLTAALVVSVAMFLVCFSYGVIHFLRERHFPAQREKVLLNATPGADPQ